MASADWSPFSDALDVASIASGVTSGITPPNGGGSFVYGFNSRTSGIDGARALKYTGDVNFDPVPSNFGGRITGAMARLASGGLTGFAPFLFFAEQANSIDGDAYMLGLQDDDPSYIVLAKGPLSAGLPAGLVGENGILAKSSASYNAGDWVHLRLDVIVQGTGDVLLQCFENDLDTNGVTSPVWTSIDGLDDVTDDVLQIETGTAPLTGGRNGFGMYANAASRRAAFDHITIARQL